MQEETIVAEFTRQAESFNRSAIATAPDMLDAIAALVAAGGGGRWLDAACGPGIVVRRLAPLVAEMHGVDMTPAMVDLARREAAAAGIGNAIFGVGDATALGLEDASFDGALARFAIHHIPLPGRMLGELARVVRPGGHVVLADHLADEDVDSAAWSLEVERLRDPSHWACLTLARLREEADRAGLALEHERVMAITLDFDDWLVRGSGGEAARAVIESALAQRPAGTECFRVRGYGSARTLELRMWLSSWRR